MVTPFAPAGLFADAVTLGGAARIEVRTAAAKTHRALNTTMYAGAPRRPDSEEDPRAAPILR